jgi:hypothetical protein
MPRRPDKRAHKQRQQTCEPRQRSLLGVLFCDGQSVFSCYADFAGVCVAAATLLEYFRWRVERSWNEQRPYPLVIGAPVSTSRATRMPVSNTPHAERKRAKRLEIARRLYEELVAQDPNRMITLRDGGGKVVARHDPRLEQDAPEMPLGLPS